MDLFEYQGKQYFARFGMPISKGGVADSVEEAVEVAASAGYPVVVKAQVKVGGRGKAGGVKLADDEAELRTHAGNILGLDIKGHVVKRLWIEHSSDIDQRVLRQLHPRPQRQEAPGHAVGRGRGGDRRGGRHQPRRHRHAPCRPGRRPEPRGGPRVGGPGQASTKAPATRRRRSWSSSTPVTPKGTATWRRSTRSSTRPTAGCTASTPRSPWTTTPPSAIPSGRSSPAATSRTSGRPGPRPAGSTTSGWTGRWGSSPTVPGWP